jgi:hypothetical protein
MRFQWTSHFIRAYRKAPKEIQAAFDKQSLLLRDRAGYIGGGYYRAVWRVAVQWGNRR